jgi:acylphosphatase
MAIKRAHIYISGSVQGVWFRATAQGVAIDGNLTGWVRNLRDGRVEMVAEGAENNLEELIRWCSVGPPDAEVTDVAVTWSDPTHEFSAFLSGETA